MGLPKEKLYLPTLYEAIYFSLIGASLLGLGVGFAAAKNYDLNNYNFFSTNIKAFIDKKFDFLDSPQWSTILTFFLWTMCGILAYLVVWFIAALVKSYNDDSVPLPTHHLLRPKGYNADNEIFTFIARSLVRMVASVLAVVWLIFLVWTIMPYLGHVFSTSLSPFEVKTIPTLFVASVLSGASLYIQIVLLRFIFLRKRLFSHNITE